MAIVRRVSVNKQRGTTKVHIIELGTNQSEIDATKWNYFIL